MNASVFSSCRPWVCALFLAAFSSVRAAPVAPDLARRVAAAWSAENAVLAPDFGEALDAVPVADADGQLLWYEVPTAGGGCLVVAPDTDLEPVVAVIPDYEGGIPEGHPLRAMLEADMRQRLSVLDATPVRRAAARSAPAAAPAATSDEVAAAMALSERKWARLADDASLAPSRKRGDRDAPLVFASSSAPATPARVYSFLDEWKRPELTHWSQNGWNTFGSWDSVYDLYTPNHYPCGCVATAGAALLQFFGVTRAPTLSNVCYVDGAKRTLTTKGGTYDWSKLPATWSRNQALTDEQKDILGRATYDMGVCLGMSYRSGGSGAPISTLATVLCEKYGFADARCVYGINAGHYEKLIYAQVRCGYPVVLSIWNNSDGHAVLAVGYGEDADAAAYTRVFMGWGGSGDAWYALPNVEDFTTVDGVVTMIGTTTATVPVCGRVVDESGTGDGFASVSRYTSSTSFTSVMANELGAWGTRVSPTLASAARKVACKGVTRTYSIGSSAATGQSYTADTLCAALPDVLTLTVPSERILPVQTTISAARGKAVAEGKLVFVLAGAQWCGYCAQLKKYLNSLGTDFSDRFVLCYLDMDEEQPAAMRVGGYPTYGIFDPRRLGEEGWTSANGMLAKDSGWVQARVDALLEEGWSAWTSVDRSPTGLELKLPSAIVSPTPCSAEVVFADGETYPLSSGVSWSVTGTAATLSDGVLAPVSGRNGTVTVRATATIAGKTLSRTATVRIVKPSDVTGLVVSGPDVIDLYDVTGAQFTALATLSDGSTASVSVAWTVTESAVTNAVISAGGLVTFPNPAKYTKASKLRVTAECNGMSASKEIDVWGWSVSLSSWTTPQRVVWPGQTIRVVPESVTWWRHGVTEEPTTDLSNVDFGIEHGWVNGKTLLSATNATSGEDGLTQKIPTDISEPEGDCSFYVTTAATRFGRAVTKAEWTEFKYLPSAPSQTVDVTFVADGGEPATQTTKYAVGYTYGFFPDAARKGYSCSWYTAAEGGTRMTTASNCVSSVTHLYARWSPRYYYISYNANGGTGSMYGHYFYYDEPANLRANTFTKEGAIFAGWSTEPGGEVVFEDEAAILNLYDSYHSLTLYASWVENGYRIAFDANGGVGTMPSQVCRLGTCSPLSPAAFTRRGATFAGWSRTPDGAAEFFDRSEVCDLATAWGQTVTLYAVWNLPAVKTIELAGPDVIDLYNVDSVQFSAVCRLANGTVADVAPKWTIEETAVTNAVVSTEGLVTIPDPKKYTKASKLRVTAECNGMSASKEIDVWGWSVSLSSWTTPQRVVWPGQTLKVVPRSVTWWRHGVTEDPTTDFTGVAFSCDGGWINGIYVRFDASSSNADGIQVTIPSGKADDQGYVQLRLLVESTRLGRTTTKYLYPSFTYLPSAPSQMVDVTFVAEGGEPATQTTKYAVGYTYGYLPTSARKGYSCSWYTAAEGGTYVSTSSNCPDSAIRLYAHWSPEYYYVTYDANGGTGSMSKSWFDYDTPAKLRANSFTKDGAMFAGWATWPGGPVVYQDKEEILNLSSVYAEIKLYAVWIENGFEVVFDANGGTGTVANRIVAPGSCIVLPGGSFTRTGYVFAGWAETPDGAAKYAGGAQACDLAASSGATVTLYAAWTPNTYAVTLNRQDGTGGTASVTAAYGSAMPAIEIPTRTGYAFGGYWTAANGGGTQYYTAKGASARAWDRTSATTLYAKWTLRAYAVTLDRRGGTGGSSQASATYGQAMPAVSVPSRAGFSFCGYWTEPDGGGVQYYTASGASARAWDIAADTTLYAKWTGKVSTVTLNAVDGSGGTASVSAIYGSPMPPIAVPTRAGYEFGGYFSSSAGTGTQYYTAAGESARDWDKTSAATLYAKWTARTFAVALDGQGGTGGTESVTATYDSALPKISAPVRAGYAFGGYYSGQSGSGTQYYTAAGTGARAWNRAFDTTLYAKWTANAYAVTLDRRGGIGGSGSATATYGSAMPAVSVPTLTGHAFGGYWTEPDGGGVQYYTDRGVSARTWDVASAATLYAKWTADSYDVTLDRQDGTGGSASATATYGEALPGIGIPARTGYAFGGYWTAANGGGVQYYTAEGASVRTWDRTSATTLYAKWTALSFAVTLDRRGGTGGSGSATAAYGSAMPAVSVPSLTGHAFGGYWTEPDGGGVQYYTASGASARAWDVDADTTLYAKWTADSYAVTLDRQDGTGGSASATATYGEALPGIEVPTRTGYAFGGYWTEPDGGGTAYWLADGTGACAWDRTGATTLYAKWTALSFAVTLDGAGGTGGTESVTATYGSPMPGVDVPSRDGFVFLGYFSAGDGGGTRYYTAVGASARTWDKADAATLYAAWREFSVFVSFDARGNAPASAVPRNVPGDGETSALPAAVPELDGFAFVGWILADGTPLESLSSVPDGTEKILLHAVWTDNPDTTLARDGDDLQSAIDAAPDGGLVLVCPGTYDPIDVRDRDIEIRAVFGPGSNVPDAAPAVIDGGNAMRCATLDEGVVLSGFVLRNGFADNGGGALGGALENCRIEDCVATVAGGAAAESALSRCTVSFCLTDGNGGGLYECAAENTVVENCDAALFGGGAYHATLTGCTVYGCGAEVGAGVAGCTVRNSIVWENRLYATDKKGVRKLGNCANVAEGKKTIYKNACTYTDSSPKPAGTGNLAKDPLFVDAANGDFRLQWTSPVKNKGKAALSLGDRDLGGLPRLIGAPDMGAHEVPDGTPVPADYDGDGIADSAYFDAATATWIVMQSRDRLRVETFGDAKATPVPADYDGDGAADFATYSATDKAPAFRIRTQLGDEPEPVALGAKGAEPFAADFDGDGMADPGVFQGNAKKPSFTVLLGTRGLARNATNVLSHTFGTKGAKAVAGDFDGDGLADVGCYTASASKPAFAMILSTNGWNTLKPLSITLGAKGSTPCCGDFDGDGTTDFAAYAGSAKTPILYRMFSTSRWRETRSLPFGEKGSRAATGDWDGDGAADPAIETRGAWRFVTPTWNVEEIPAP